MILMSLVYLFGGLFVAITLFLTGRTITAMNENEEIKKLNKILEEKSGFLRNVIESLKHPFYVIDVNNYKIRLANSAAQLDRLYDTSTCYQLTHRKKQPCGSKEHICPLEQMKKTGKPVTVEHIHYDKNGYKRNVEVHAYPIFNKDGKLVEMIEYTLDITKRKKAEMKAKQLNKELIQAKDDLERLLEQKNEFIHILSHDLKNPLSAPLNLLPILEKKIEDEQLKKMVQTVYHSVEQIKSIIYDTLKLARLDNLEKSVSIEKINLFELAERAISNNKQRIKEYQFSIENTIPKNQIIHADKFLLSQVFDNLLSNAIKYTFDEDKQQIIISSEKINNSVLVSVKDYGRGIEKNHLSDIFDKFSKQCKPREGFDSTGLGLAISKKIVEKLGGKIWVESEGLGKGSTFSIMLPFHQQNQSNLDNHQNDMYNHVKQQIDVVISEK
ncbi:MAG: ATP-binding protein [Thermoplasmatota archaeon]